jgi:hypothetical protein
MERNRNYRVWGRSGSNSIVASRATNSKGLSRALGCLHRSCCMKGVSMSKGTFCCVRAFGCCDLLPVGMGYDCFLLRGIEIWPVVTRLHEGFNFSHIKEKVASSSNSSTVPLGTSLSRKVLSHAYHVFILIHGCFHGSWMVIPHLNLSMSQLSRKVRAKVKRWVQISLLFLKELYRGIF